MRKSLLGILLLSVFFFSCSNRAKQETANKMADEMCKAMELWDKDNPMSLIEATSEMTKVLENSEEYSKVSKEQLISTMQNKCPKGADKLVKLFAQKE